MKKGIANRAKLSNPVAMRCAMVVTAAKLGRLTNRVRSEERAILQATGVPKPMKIKKPNPRP